jgi:hypothetical protein
METLTPDAIDRNLFLAVIAPLPSVASPVLLETVHGVARHFVFIGRMISAGDIVVEDETGNLNTPEQAAAFLPNAEMRLHEVSQRLGISAAENEAWISTEQQLEAERTGRFVTPSRDRSGREF